MPSMPSMPSTQWTPVDPGAAGRFLWAPETVSGRGENSFGRRERSQKVESLWQISMVTVIPSPVHTKHPLGNYGLVGNFHIIGTI